MSALVIATPAKRSAALCVLPLPFVVVDCIDEPFAAFPDDGVANPDVVFFRMLVVNRQTPNGSIDMCCSTPADTSPQISIGQSRVTGIPAIKARHDNILISNLPAKIRYVPMVLGAKYLAYADGLPGEHAQKQLRWGRWKAWRWR